MLSMHMVVVVVVGSFIHCLLPEEGAWPPSHPTVAAVTVGAGLSLSVRVLETPGLHGSDEEVLRAEGLVVESVAVACATPVQVPVDVERLAAPSTYDEAVIAPSHEHGLSLGGQVEVPSG